ncbi:RloB family protein [Nocardia camponoti]|uniref:RloB domain-containing protein n=1 Tax=Nocardia camponoti TaxID=1616106 RepID=A0A917V4N0_9NOCA|nr:hypothetical protein GCM10011591_05950 [Nocardia camponoti]
MNSRKGKHPAGFRPSRRRGHEDDSRDLHRQAGRDRGQRIIYVACEGEQTEPDYLDYLNERFGCGTDDRKPFLIHAVWEKNGLLPLQTVAKVKQRADDCEAWVLFDRDGTDRDADIERAVRAAAKAQVELAFSHPSFDLWLLLHFRSVSGAQHGSSKLIVEKLRRATTSGEFHDYDKRNNKSIGEDRKKALFGNEATAVRNARALVGQCEHGACKASNAEHRFVPRNRETAWTPAQWSGRSGHADHCPILGRDPSTDVWRLLVSLGIVR